MTYGNDGSAIYEHGRRAAEALAPVVTVANIVEAEDAFCAALVLAPGGVQLLHSAGRG